MLVWVLGLACSESEKGGEPPEDTDTGEGPETTAPPLPSCADEDGGSVVPVAWTGTLRGQGDQYGSYCNPYAGGEDYAFTFTAPADGEYSFDGTGTQVGHVIAVYDGCGGYELSCDIAQAVAGSSWLGRPVAAGARPSAWLAQGQTAVVVIDTSFPELLGDFVVWVDQVHAQESDCADGRDEDYDLLTDCLDEDCASEPGCAEVCPDESAAELAVISGTTLGAPDEERSSCDLSPIFQMDAPDRSLEFTAPADGRYAFALSTTGTDFNAVLSLFNRCGGRELACSDLPLLTGGEALATELLAGETVVVVVDGFAEQQGAFELHVFEPSDTEDCSDGLDNDVDGAPDCSDTECQQASHCAEDCVNGIDDNGDAAVDCSDLRCAADAACPEDCENLVDDDGDMWVDCVDEGCADHPGCQVCPDGVLDNQLPVTVAGSTLGLSDDWESCTGGGHTSDAAWEFTAPADGTYTFDTIGSEVRLTLSISDTCGDAFSICSGSPNYYGVPIDLVAGQTVIVVIDTQAFFESGNYVLHVQ